ncbi:TPA: helix-turn-helix transcriptional regulator [Streptococcus suis]|nr:helix-turn-helix transcriptional regulator [Streptococcus suis]HEM2770407.1 helix-turn-helix transcriptional regulator [Streptococcus suis]HEM4277527.1 helix-turn-helix transcriptional regulator [Streptococcus suis]HEM6017839.1 helix-turn-helix transcriptional regulator [Streptococcus suis]
MSFRNTYENYTSINNACLQDERLGPATIGILAVVLSNKPDWVVYPEEIAKRMGVSRQFVNKHFKILEEAGYLFVIKKGAGRAKGVTPFRFFNDKPFTDKFKEYIQQKLDEELSTGNNAQ